MPNLAIIQLYHGIKFNAYPVCNYLLCFTGYIDWKIKIKEFTTESTENETRSTV